MSDDIPKFVICYAGVPLAWHVRPEDMAIDEARTAARAYTVLREGEEARRMSDPCPHGAGTIRSMLHCYGWTREDMRIALMRASGLFAESQRAMGQGLVHLPELGLDPDPRNRLVAELADLKTRAASIEARLQEMAP